MPAQTDRPKKRNRLRFRRNTRRNTVPDRFRADPTAPAPEISVFLWNADSCVEEQDVQVSKISLPTDPATRIWLNVSGLGDADAIRRIGDQFGLHPLALEDVVHVHQRPKIEDYGDVLFLVSRMVTESEQFETEQVSLFVGRKFIVTFQERPGDCFKQVRDRLRSGQGMMRSSGPDYLLYSLLDAIIDGYFPRVESSTRRLDYLEELIATTTKIDPMHAIRKMKTDLRLMRRTVTWQRDALLMLVRGEFAPIAPSVRIYLRDCADHSMQLLDAIEMDREMCSDISDHYFALLSIRNNDVSRVLTIIATLFMPMGVVAGIYGMNFDPSVSQWNMPELKWAWGYPFALSLMATFAVGMTLWFWVRGWFHR